MNVSAILVARETGEIDAVGDGDGVGDGVGAGVTLSLTTEDVAAGEISFFGEGALLGVADVAAFDGVGVGDLRPPDGEIFDFGVGVGVGLGTGVCAPRSTPM